jgi:hypothetical protein
MEIETADFVVELFEAMRWYLYHEQVEPIPIVKKVRGTDIRLDSEFSSVSAMASGARFDAYELQIVPGSRSYRTPEQRLQTIVQWWQSVILPGLQMGLTRKAPDLDQLNEIGARYSDLPELRMILRDATEEEMQAASAGGGEGPGKPPVTTRNYVRRGSPGPTNKGMAMQAMQMMGGGKDSQ